MSHFFGTAIAASPLQVFSWPHLRDLNGVPEFYKSLVLAWRALDGGFSAQRSSLVLSSRTPAAAVSVAAMSCKLCYNVLLGNSWSPPHCVATFAHFGDLYWFTTWRQLFFYPVDRPGIDLSWKIAHGVVFTAARLCHFGYDVSLACFCGERVETLDHLFFYCPLAQSGISWFQSLLFRCSPLSPVLVCRHLSVWGLTYQFCTGASSHHVVVGTFTASGAPVAFSQRWSMAGWFSKFRSKPSYGWHPGRFYWLHWGCCFSAALVARVGCLGWRVFFCLFFSSLGSGGSRSVWA